MAITYWRILQGKRNRKGCIISASSLQAADYTVSAAFSEDAGLTLLLFIAALNFGILCQVSHNWVAVEVYTVHAAEAHTSTHCSCSL